jgi:S1-C subfamily serine protease
VKIRAIERDSARELRIGRARGVDFRVGARWGVRRDHARILVDSEGAAVLRARGPVRIHGQPIREVRLRDGDLVQVGRAALIRVSIPGPDGSPIGLQDAGRPASAHHGSHLSIPRILVATLAFATLIVTAALVVNATRPAPPGVEEALAAARSDRDSDLARERRRVDTQIETMQIEVDRRLGDVKRSLSNMDSAVDARVKRAVASSPELQAAQDAIGDLVENRRAAERVIADCSPAVCVVQGAYAFGRKVRGEWRFLRELDAQPDPNDEANENLPLSLEGRGEVFKVEYTGTGFLADRAGIVLTNRHIAQPWWKNDAAAPILDAGFEARFLYLRAYFPGRKRAVTFDPAQSIVSNDADLAALRFHLDAEALPLPLPLASSDQLPRGRRIVMLGFPSGLSALLARGDEEESERLSTSDDFDPIKVLDTLAARGYVRPLPAQGHVNDLVADKLLFDAPSEVGGSGAPVLDLEGRVVAINYGILKAFSGTNFGVPSRFAARLLDRARKAAEAEPAEKR